MKKGKQAHSPNLFGVTSFPLPEFGNIAFVKAISILIVMSHDA